MKNFSLSSKIMFVVAGLALSFLVVAGLSIWSLDQIDENIVTIANKIKDSPDFCAGKTEGQIGESCKALRAEVDEAMKIYKDTRWFLLVVTAIAIFVALGFALTMVTRMRKAIETVVGSLESNTMEFEGASMKIADSATKLSSAAISQGSSLTQTASSAQELTSIVERNLDNARRAFQVSEASQVSAEKGKRVVGEMAKAISEIDESNDSIMKQVEESNRQIAEITKVIAEIGNKTKVINDIVFQTRLLSFNASVEAARAGEHGRGFAVVAEEVGNLAQMSGNAAKEISGMLEASIEKVENIVNDTRRNVDFLVQQGKVKVDAGTKIVQECATVLDEIVNYVRDVTQMSDNIAESSHEQAKGVAEISRAMIELDQVTQTNASAADQAAHAAQHLADQAQDLKSTVHDLIVLVRGEAAGRLNARRVAVAAPVNRNVVSITNSAKMKSTVVAAKPLMKASADKKSGGSSGGSSNGSSGPQSSSSGAPPSTPKAPPVAAASSKSAPPKAKPRAAKPVAALAPEIKDAAPAKAPAKEEPASLQLVAGADLAIPSEDDPRFKDV